MNQLLGDSSGCWFKWMTYDQLNGSRHTSMKFELKIVKRKYIERAFEIY